MVLLSHALDAGGRVISAADAERSGAYICLECREPLLLKRGEVRQPHFAHLAGSACSGEHAVHLAAKWRLRERLEQGPVAVVQPCLSAGCAEQFTGQWPPVTYDGVFVEVPFMLGTQRYVADVGVMRGGELVAVGEVVWSHHSEAEKKEALRGSGLAWLEVRAADVLEPQLSHLAPVATGAVKLEGLEEKIFAYRRKLPPSAFRVHASVQRLVSEYLSRRFLTAPVDMTPLIQCRCERCEAAYDALGQLLAVPLLPPVWKASSARAELSVDELRRRRAEASVLGVDPGLIAQFLAQSPDPEHSAWQEVLARLHAARPALPGTPAQQAYLASRPWWRSALYAAARQGLSPVAFLRIPEWSYEDQQLWPHAGSGRAVFGGRVMYRYLVEHLHADPLQPLLEASVTALRSQDP